MFEMILGGVIAFNVFAMGSVWFSLRDMKTEFSLIAKEINSSLVDVEINVPDIQDLKEDIFSIMSEMRTPNFLDHVGGGLSQIMMAIAQKKMRQSELLNVNNQPPESHPHAS